MSEATFAWKDYDGEPSSTSINTDDITSANFDAQSTLVGDLRVALNGLTLEPVQKSVLKDDLWNTLVLPTDPLAQREIKWFVIVSDNISKYKAMEIPVANLALLENNSKYIVRNGSPTIVTGLAAVQAFITAFEAVALSKAGDALQVVDIYQAGRNT